MGIFWNGCYTFLQRKDKDKNNPYVFFISKHLQK